VNKVNALIIGAGRSGTTSLFAYLEQHPEIACSITKEVHYFSVDDLYKRGESYLHSLFESNNKKIIATADTYLLMDAIAPQRIKLYNPDMKIIIMLREPVARAYSNFNYSVNFGHEKEGIGFLETIALEKERLQNLNIVDKNNQCHFYGSLYHQHISFWKKYFPMEQIIILQLSDLKNNPETLYHALCSKLGIKFQPFDKSAIGLNAASGAKSKWLQQLLLNRDNPVRKVLSFMLRPFRNLVIKSGFIDKIHAINKKKVAIKPLTMEEQATAAQYFQHDLKLLAQEFGIIFKN